MKTVLLSMCLIVGGCAPRVGDDLVDQVVSRNSPFSDCVLVGHTQVFANDDEPGPPALLTPMSFSNLDVRAAAKTVARSWRSAKNSGPSFYGIGLSDNCATKVNRPLYAGDFAFVDYSEPGGEIGAYAFRRDGGGWQIAEKVRLGFW